MSAYGEGSFTSGNAKPLDKRPIVFFGNERLATGVTTAAPTLLGLLEGGFNVVAVVSHNETSNSRKQRSLEIAEIAKNYNVPVLLPAKPAEILDQLKAFEPMIGVLVAYGKIVPQSVIDVFPHGILNIHPSLLPLHRGPTPLESVILDGSTKTGVSLMKLAKEMDAGPVYAQTDIELTRAETKQELANTLINIGASMVVDLLPEILDGTVIALPQDDTVASYDHLIAKTDGKLNWDKPAEQLEREIRAYASWPTSYATLAGKDLVITKAHVAHNQHQANQHEVGKAYTEDKTLRIQTKYGVLVIDALKPAGKNEMPAEAFLAGYGKNL